MLSAIKTIPGQAEVKVKQCVYDFKKIFFIPAVFNTRNKEKIKIL